MRRSFLLALLACTVAGCSQLPVAPASAPERDAGSVLRDVPPVRPPCDTTGGTPCHGTLPWY